MEILNFIFRIGVILAVYNFLWWLIMAGFTLLRGKKPHRIPEVYLIKTVRYTFLADVMFLFVLEESGGLFLMSNFIITGSVLLFYFIGRLQKKRDKQLFFNFSTQTNIPDINNLINKMKPVFNLQLEILVIAITMLLFISFYYFQNLAFNPISNWFLESILNIEDTPVFGFIFKVIGFFFLLSVLMKIITGISLLLLPQQKKNNQDDYNDSDDFDDFEEIK